MHSNSVHRDLESARDDFGRGRQRGHGLNHVVNRHAGDFLRPSRDGGFGWYGGGLQNFRRNDIAAKHFFGRTLRRAAAHVGAQGSGGGAPNIYGGARGLDAARDIFGQREWTCCHRKSSSKRAPGPEATEKRQRCLNGPRREVTQAPPRRQTKKRGRRIIAWARARPATRVSEN